MGTDNLQAQAFPPRVAAFHDLSCIGRCALSAVLPTLSVMGCQAIPIPTALLSTQTDGYTGFYYRDLSAELEGILAHFKELNLTFDAVYTGFLGGEAQVKTVERFLEYSSQSEYPPLILIDPVMGDHGALYQTYTPEMAEAMRALTVHAHILTPNLTEACILTDTPYWNSLDCDQATTCARVTRMLQSLSHGAKQVVITGILLPEDQILNMGIDKTGEIFSVLHEHTSVSYPGTGDLFASLLLGSFLKGSSFFEAVRFAAEFVSARIRASIAAGAPLCEGVLLEPFEVPNKRKD